MTKASKNSNLMFTADHVGGKEKVKKEEYKIKMLSPDVKCNARQKTNITQSTFSQFVLC